MQRVWIGTSGWVYKHWAESFYPKDWPKKDEFLFYITQFPTVEINATFYRLPGETMVKGWRKKAPEGFVFAVKGSRFITHIKRLKEPKEGLGRYFERISLLKEKIGPILWQLPPSFDSSEENQQRVKEFVNVLPAKYQHAMEFRHPSWIAASTFEVLRKANVALVCLSSQRMPMDFTTTADFVYARFHGLANGAAHDYTEEELRPWAEQLRRCAEGGQACYAYFNNDWNTRAPLNAKLLGQMLGDLTVPAFEAVETVRKNAAPEPKRRKTTAKRQKRAEAVA